MSWRGIKLHGSEINSNTCNIQVKLLIFPSDKLPKKYRTTYRLCLIQGDGFHCVIEGYEVTWMGN